MSSDRREGQEYEADRESTGLGKSFWFSAVVVGFIVAGLVFVLVSPTQKKTPSSSGGGSSTAALSPSPDDSGSSSPTQTPSTQDTAWADHGCNGTSGDASVPTTPPRGVVWQPQGSMSYPTSGQVGPKHTSGVLRTCFQHSPTGALFAAANFIVAASSGPTTSRVVEEKLITPGLGKDQMLGDLTGDDNKAGTASPAGFQLGACTPDRCIVNLFVSGGEGAATFTMPMVWSDGDWKLDGSTALQPALVQALPAGWSQWPTS